MTSRKSDEPCPWAIGSVYVGSVDDGRVGGVGGGRL